MTNETIIRKAIEKADKNGWKEWKNYFPAFPKVKYNNRIHWKIVEGFKEKIIFSHDFAKCLWGEKIKCNECDLEQKKHKITKRKYFYSCSNCGILVEGQYAQESWKNHLQKLVLEKEPLKYIAKFL